MSVPHRSAKIVRTCLATLLAVAVGLFTADPAGAIVSCSRASTDTLVIALNFPADTVTINRDAAGNFQVTGTGMVAGNCASTLANTVKVQVASTVTTVGNKSVTIDLAGGGFARPGGSYVLFEVTLDAGAADKLFINGSSGSDGLALLPGASTEVDLNGDATADVTATGINELDFVGNDGNDVLSFADQPAASPLVQRLRGGNGDDTLVASVSNDTIDGGAGNDTAAFTSTVIAAAVTVDLSLQPAAQATGSAGSDTLSAIENLVGSPFNDVLKGDANDNRLAGGAGNDDLAGLGGSDTASFAGETLPVTVDLSAAIGARQTGGDGNDTIADDIEGVLGTAFDDDITGNAFANPLSGDGGDDALGGLGGADVLSGGAGDDLLEGGDGSDTLRGGADADAASYADRPVGVAIDLAAANPRQLPGEGSNADVIDDDVENLIGTSFNDTLSGNEGANAIDGGGGNDVITAKGGNDLLLGGAGSDSLFGGFGDDTETGGPGNDFLNQESAKNGADILLGGPDNDIVIYRNRTNPVTATRDDIADDGEAGENDDVGSDVEFVSFPVIAGNTTGEEPAPPGQGYTMAAADGSLYLFGSASFYGSPAGLRLNAPIVGITRTPSGQGYWLVGSDGGIFSYGDAAFYGSTGATPLNSPILGMEATPTGGGYWLFAGDGGIFSFGDAAFYGSTGGMRLNKPIVGMATTPDGSGYWLVASDGGVFTFGAAAFEGSMGAVKLNSPVIDMMADPDGRGYWLGAADGGIFSFEADFHGSAGAVPLNKPIRGLAATPSGGGYWFVASDGGVFAYGDAQFFGSLGGRTLSSPIVGLAS